MGEEPSVFMQCLGYFYLIIVPTVSFLGLYLNQFKDKVYNRIINGYSVDDFKPYFKWYWWEAKKRSDWLLLVCQDRPIERLEFITEQFTKEHFFNTTSTLAFWGIHGKKNPVHELIYLWSGNTKNFHHAYHLEEKFGLRVEDHEYYHPVYNTHDEYIKFRKFKKRQKNLGMVE